MSGPVIVVMLVIVLIIGIVVLMEITDKHM